VQAEKFKEKEMKVDNWILEMINNRGGKSYEEIFGDIAKKLFEEYYLKVGNYKLYLTEVEFYFYSDGHKDTYTHMQKYQKEFGFHLHYTGWGGTDLTFGDANIYGGILLRGMKIKHYDDYKYFNGPWIVTNAILNMLNNEIVENLHIDAESDSYNTFFDKGNLLETKDILLCKNNTHISHEVYRAPRIGLSCKEIDNKFLVKNYRFICDKDITKNSFKEKTIVDAVSKKNASLLKNLTPTKRIIKITKAIDKA
jgi:hypothetical protein